ncbi:gp200 [Bacillus phage G]|uniref:Gp200 n=1 Tax=Bacillus phage G TaxID=2884420 RepID=G3MBR6_9CAUD|nr:gp200 [Bacillus phage G]AEO93459.1 gp200 [Bacillus phage G]
MDKVQNNSFIQEAEAVIENSFVALSLMCNSKFKLETSGSGEIYKIFCIRENFDGSHIYDDILIRAIVLRKQNSEGDGMIKIDLPRKFFKSGIIFHNKLKGIKINQSYYNWYIDAYTIDEANRVIDVAIQKIIKEYRMVH